MSFIGAQPDRTAYTGGGIYKASEQLAMYQSQMFPDAFYEPISSQTLIRHTNKRTGSINNVDIRSFTFTDLNSYDVYYWNISGLKMSNDFNTDAYLRVQFSETNGDSFLTGNYQYNRYYLHSNSTADADSRSSSNTMIPITMNFHTDAHSSGSVELWFFPNSVSGNPRIISKGVTTQANNYPYSHHTVGGNTTTNLINALKIDSSQVSNNAAQLMGHFDFYGINYRKTH